MTKRTIQVYDGDGKNYHRDLSDFALAQIDVIAHVQMWDVYLVEIEAHRVNGWEIVDLTSDDDGTIRCWMMWRKLLAELEKKKSAERAILDIEINGTMYEDKRIHEFYWISGDEDEAKVRFVWGTETRVIDD